MPDLPIVMNVHMQAVPGREEDLAVQLRSLLEPTRKEAGCLAYELHRDPEDPGKFMFYEKFASEAALAAHLDSPHFKKFLSYREAKGDPIAAQTVTRWRNFG